MAIYRIDGSDVNGRIDWRHQVPRRAASALRMEGFPGSPLRFAMVGELLGPTFAVEGFLQGATFAALHAAVAAADALKVTPEVHTVVIHDVSYADCQLAGLSLLGGPRPMGDQGSVVQVQRVRYEWVKLTDGGAA